MQVNPLHKRSHVVRPQIHYPRALAAFHRAVAAISALPSAVQSSKPTDFFVEA
jgi:hypothetical protein